MDILKKFSKVSKKQPFKIYGQTHTLWNLDFLKRSPKRPLRLLLFLKPNLFTFLVILNCSSCVFLDQPNLWRQTPDFKFKRLLLGAIIVGKFLCAHSQTPQHNIL